MIKDVINNVFVLSDGLESVINAFTFNDPDIRFHTIRLDDDAIEGIDALDKVKEHNLILINYANFTPEKRSVLTGFFLKSFKFSFPYILYITDRVLDAEEERAVHLSDAYYYPAPVNGDTHYTTHFRFFIRALFEKLHYIGRINDYIIDAFQTIVNAQIIEDQKNEILLLNSELKKLSKTDYLTNLLNRRAFFDALEAERKRTLREHWRLHDIESVSSKPDKIEESVLAVNKPHGCFFDHYGNFSCIIIDIDHFKQINDTYGHLKGDEVLRELGRILNSDMIFRQNDTIARYGGEEFVVMLPETNTFHAKIPAERLRKLIKTMQFSSDEGVLFRVTISVGISEFRVTDTTNEDIINRADQALYFAKENGRDQVVVYEDIMKD